MVSKTSTSDLVSTLTSMTRLQSRLIERRRELADMPQGNVRQQQAESVVLNAMMAANSAIQTARGALIASSLDMLV